MNDLCRTPIGLFQDETKKGYMDDYAEKIRDEFYLEHLKGTVCSTGEHVHPSHGGTTIETQHHIYDQNNNGSDCSGKSVAHKLSAGSRKKTTSGSSKRRRSTHRRSPEDAPSYVYSFGSNKSARSAFGSTKRSGGDPKIQNLAKRFRSSEYLAGSPKLTEKLRVYKYDCAASGKKGSSVVYDDYVVIDSTDEKSVFDYYKKWSDDQESNSLNPTLATPEYSLYCYEKGFPDEHPFSESIFADVSLSIFAVTSLDKADIRDVYWQMKKKECYSHANHSLSEQKIITPRCRYILVDWLVAVTHHYKIQGETLHLAVNILDRYIERECLTIVKKDLQLIGITSLLVAAKQLEVEIPPVSSCLGLCRNFYTRRQLLSLERLLLITIEFDLNVPTSHLFYDAIISMYYDVFVKKCHAMRVREDPDTLQDYFVRLLCIGRSFLEKGLTNYQFVQFAPSLAARAAFRLSTSILERSSFSIGMEVFRDSTWGEYSPFQSSLEHSFRDAVAGTEEELLEYEEESVISCHQSLRSLYDDVELEGFADSLDKFVPKYLYE